MQTMGKMQAENPDSKVIRPQPGECPHNASYIKPSCFEGSATVSSRTWLCLSLFFDFYSFSFFLPHFPGMCVKTLSEPGKQKIFVNICQSNSVPLPPELSREELVELLQSEDPSGYRVPMSLGEPHTEIDNSTSLKLKIVQAFYRWTSVMQKGHTHTEMKNFPKLTEIWAVLQKELNVSTKQVMHVTT